MIQWLRLCPLNAEGTGSIPGERTKSESDSHSVASDSLQPHGLWPTRLLCPWDSPGKNIGVNCHALLQGIFLAQESNMNILRCRRTLYHLCHWRRKMETGADYHIINATLELNIDIKYYFTYIYSIIFIMPLWAGVGIIQWHTKKLRWKQLKDLTVHI